MPQRNIFIILFVFLASLFCYVAHQRTKTALFVGDALDLIDNYYVDEVDKEALLIAAMDGMTAQLDQHSDYIPADEFENFQHNINQEFAGIGIYVEQPIDGPPVRVITPLVGSPALRAGILPGDEFLRIGGEDVSKLGLQEVSQRLKGPIGTVVDVVVRRGSGEQQQEIQMQVSRETIELESVIGDYRDVDNRWVYRLKDEPSIAYVRLSGFGEKTVAELERVLVTLDNDFQALVFDLRGNGGGLLDTAVAVSDMFLSEGEIVSTRTRGGVMEDSFAATSGTLVDLDKPLAILIDGNSASASEIVAACLQDNGRASIVGTRSYGKGTVQNVLPMRYGKSALRLTVARFYRPSGENLHRAADASEDQSWGVQPGDGLVVELDEESRDAIAKNWRQIAYPALVGSPSSSREVGAGEEPADDQNPQGLLVDPQLRRAVEHLQEQVNGQPLSVEAA